MRVCRSATGRSRLEQVLEAEAVHRKRARRFEGDHLDDGDVRQAGQGDRLRTAPDQRNLPGIHGTQPVPVRHAGCIRVISITLR